MALQKEITSNNGAIATYHRIKSIVRNYKILEICLECYASEEYREKEKVVFEIAAELDALTLRYSELTGMDLENMTEDEIAERDEIKNKLDTYEDYLQMGEYPLYNINASIPWEDNEDISFAGIYQVIKETHEVFEDAVDC